MKDSYAILLSVLMIILLVFLKHGLIRMFVLSAGKLLRTDRRRASSRRTIVVGVTVSVAVGTAWAEPRLIPFVIAVLMFLAGVACLSYCGRKR